MARLGVVGLVMAGFLVAGLVDGRPAAAQGSSRRSKPRRAKKPKKPAPPPVDREKAAMEKLDKQLLDLQVKGAMYPALRLARRIYQIKEKKLGATHPDAIRALELVASFTAATGNYTEALQIHRDLLARAEKVHGKGSVGTVTAMETLATQLWVAQRFGEADAMYLKVLALKKQQHGEESAMYATALQSYAGLLWARHAYAAAEQRYFEAKAILDKISRPDDPSHAGIIMGLGWLYWAQGQQAKAARQFDKALAILEKMYTETLKDPSQIGAMLLSIASVYASGGRADWARPLEERGEKLYRQALVDIEKEHGPSDARLLTPLSSLGSMHQRRKEWDQAERMYRRAMAIQAAQKQPSSEMSQLGFLTSLAYLERQRGRARAALPLLGRVRAIYKKTYGDYMASTMDHQIADIRREMGDYRAARRMLEKVVKTSRRTWGARHPIVAGQLFSLAMLHIAEGKPKLAVGRMREALEIQEPHIALILATGTESDNATYFSRIAYELHLAISLHARHAPDDRDAARLAITTLLRRKGRILDAAAATVATLRGKVSPADQKLLDELAAARAQLAKLIVAGPKATDTPEAYSVEVARLEREVRRLEDLVRRSSSAYRVNTRPIELAAVQNGIPSDGVLVEMVVYQPYDARAPAYGPAAGKAPPPRRYGAYLLRKTGEPTWIDLGEARVLDQLAGDFLGALADPARGDVDKLGRALYDRALKRLVAGLGQTRRVLVAPDGLLNLVPLGAVVDDSGRHLVRRFNISYLTSGRDLLRLGSGARAKQGPVIIADPVFDGDAGTGATPRARPKADASSGPSRGRRSRDLRGRRWERLPGTAEEADALAPLLDQVKVLRGTRATEGALKELRGPRLLHIATHGFFLPAEPPPRDPSPGDEAPGGPPLPIFGAQAVTESGPENPLLRSGLALAGANKLSSGGDDGILTALEAAGLDLWGTQMVVLSACETGVGKVTEGDGVHGLRRALVIAGAESLVMSLWQVDDNATRELMTGFYNRLEGGEGRSEALRQVQLKMLRNSRTSHPYYWASFVPTGSWAPLAH